MSLAIFSSILRLQNLPIIQKKIEAITIPKEGNYMKFPQNRRPNSLLSSLGKIYEIILLNRLINQKSRPVSRPQFLKLTEYITSGLEILGSGKPTS